MEVFFTVTRISTLSGYSAYIVWVATFLFGTEPPEVRHTCDHNILLWGNTCHIALFKTEQAVGRRKQCIDIHQF